MVQWYAGARAWTHTRAARLLVRAQRCNRCCRAGCALVAAQAYRGASDFILDGWQLHCTRSMAGGVASCARPIVWAALGGTSSIGCERAGGNQGYRGNGPRPGGWVQSSRLQATRVLPTQLQPQPIAATHLRCMMLPGFNLHPIDCINSCCSAQLLLLQWMGTATAT